MRGGRLKSMSGGKRPGAGRPKGARNKKTSGAKFTTIVRKETLDWIKRQKQQHRLSQGKTIDMLVKFWIDNH